MDVYAKWRLRLRGEKPALVNGEAEAGFWRVRTIRNGPWEALAVWHNDTGQLYKIGLGGAVEVTREWAESVFSFAVKNPVTEPDYREALANGRWPDAVPDTLPITQPGGTNMPDDEFGQLLAELEDERQAIEDWLAATTIATQAEADKATNWVVKIDGIERRRVALFEDEKKPIREQGRVVDERFGAPKAMLAGLKGRLKVAQTDFLLAKDQRERDERAAAEAERRRQEAAKAAPGNSAPGPAPASPPPAAKAQRATSGTAGRKVGLVEIRTGVIEDFDACYAALKDHAHMLEFVQSLADRAAKADVPLAGVRIQREQVAR